MHSAQDVILELQARLERFPARRYPVQHATAQFHLGIALAQAGELGLAESALATAAAIFDPKGLAAEHGKALNALGAVLRLAGRRDEAAQVLLRAVVAFEAAGLVAEEGAARFNLGLVRRESGDLPGAADDLAEARHRFQAAAAPAAAAGAARELGALRLHVGDFDGARDALQDALDLARQGGDEPSAGEAANVLGLVELADGRPREAADAFCVAVAAHPRSVRPGSYAMAKANLALAYERSAESLAARVAARHALGVASAAAPVRDQAAEVLARLVQQDRAGVGSEAGAGGADAAVLLGRESPEGRAAAMREELARWLDLGGEGLDREVAGWAAAQLARPEIGTELAAALLSGLLELPGASMDRVIRALVRASARQDPSHQEQLRAEVAMASARFHVPQLLRLRDAFNAMAAQEGEPATWR